MLEVKVMSSIPAMDALPRLGDLRCIAKEQPRHYSLWKPASQPRRLSPR